jgi:hypothetical protein
MPICDCRYDRIRIDEIISNLLTNAVESTEWYEGDSSAYDQGRNAITVFTINH